MEKQTQIKAQRKNPFQFKFNRKRTNAVYGFLFLLPLIIGIIVFAYGPMAMAIGISFTEYNIPKDPEFIGLENFEYLITWERGHKALINTTIYMIGSIITSVPLAIFFAIILNQSLRGVTIYRTIYYLPSIASAVGIGLMWRYLMLGTQNGFINSVLSLISLPKIPWLTNGQWAMVALIMVGTWRATGYNCFLYLAALQGVPREYHEAALIDGANNFQRFISITIPLISPTIFFHVLTGVIACFQEFGLIQMLTGGGPQDSTLSIVMLIYQEAFAYGHMGRATAFAVVTFILIAILSIIQFQFQDRWVYYQSR